MEHSQQVNLQTWARANRDNLKVLINYLKIELDDLKEALTVSFDHQYCLITQGKAIQVKEIISELEARDNKEE